ncbi:uncharacterized protein LOC115984632 [Quercus lobata]|uniref:uncharacterized protein LOC115984632 n=1 Tax=Quercus lobata TaxID=97700 RepID=UPI00124801ED|nr:uncharacterized protein LOC115984632 [Quercus lobata]
MGAILQVLTHTRALRSAIDSSEHFCDQQFCPVDLLRNFMKEMQNGSLKPYNPSEFLNTLEDILKKTGANLKWDASTCFSGLLAGLEESGKPIAEIFLSEIIQEYYCHYCWVSMKQPIEYEAIDLHDIEGLTVIEAVRQFRVGKIIDRDCTVCNPGGEMEQIDYFSKLPQILVFKQKKSVANDGQLENEIILRDPDRTRHFYTLYGVVLQQVDGNYSSYIHHGDGWVGFSDQNISWVDKFPYEDDPCMLFYEKGDPKVRAIQNLQNQSLIGSVLHILAETDALRIAIRNHHCTNKEACGGFLLKKFMSEISDDPYDVSDFSELLPLLLEREKQAAENTPYSFFKALVNGLVRCEVSKGPMEDIFICTSYTTSRCLKCSYGPPSMDDKKDPCFALEVDVNNMKTETVVKDWLMHEVDVHCTYCEGATRSRIFRQFRKLPEILTFEIKILENHHKKCPLLLCLSDSKKHHLYSLYGLIKKVRVKNEDCYCSYIRQGNSWVKYFNSITQNSIEEQLIELPNSHNLVQVGSQSSSKPISGAWTKKAKRTIGRKRPRQQINPTVQHQDLEENEEGDEAPDEENEERGEVPAALEQRRQLGESEEGGEVPAVSEQRRQLGENDEGGEVPAALEQRRQLGENEEGGEVPAALEQRRQLGENEEVPATSRQRRRIRIRGKEVPAASGQRRRIRIRGKRERRYAGG